MSNIDSIHQCCHEIIGNSANKCSRSLVQNLLSGINSEFKRPNKDYKWSRLEHRAGYHPPRRCIQNSITAPNPLQLQYKNDSPVFYFYFKVQGLLLSCFCILFPLVLYGRVTIASNSSSWRRSYSWETKETSCGNIFWACSAL